MSDGLGTSIDDAPALHARLQLPYTLTTGRAAGAFLAELARRRILGSRCDGCSRVVVPPQDFCGRCGSGSATFVEVPPTGTVSAITRTARGTVALVRLDGVDGDLLHRVDEGTGAVARGTRVRATWSDSPAQSILDLAAFVADESAPEGAVTPVDGEVASIAEQPYALDLHYHHAYGPHYGRLFDELATRRRIVGSTCPSCSNVLVPPREICDVCYVRTGQHVDVADTGVLQAFSVIHMEFVGQTRKPPYVYAEIVLDGSATRLIHTVGGFDMSKAQERLRIGMPVRAVWKDAADCQGTLADIDYFEPADDG